MKQIIKTSMIAILLISGLTANAQYQYRYEQPRLTFGVKSGVVFSDLGGYRFSTNNKFGYTGGLVFNYFFKSDNFYASTGLEFSNKGSKFDLVVEDEMTKIKKTYLKSRIVAMYLQMPFHIGYKFDLSERSRLFIQGGAYIAYGVEGENELGDRVRIESAEGVQEIPLRDDEGGLHGMKVNWKTFDDNGFKRFDVGLGAAIAYEYDHVNIAFKYDWGLSDAKQNTGKARNRTGYITLGYRF